MSGIILFDGICGLCHASVQFVLKRDPKGYFQFCALQSQTGRELLALHQVPAEIDSFVLIEHEAYYVKSSAALRVCRNLSGPWKLLSALAIIPAPARDFIYDIIAQNRYKWFGKHDSCLLPAPKFKNRFLE